MLRSLLLHRLSGEGRARVRDLLHGTHCACKLGCNVSHDNVNSDMGRGSPHVGKRMAQVDQISSLIVASRFTQRILSSTQNFTQAHILACIILVSLYLYLVSSLYHIILKSSMVWEVQECQLIIRQLMMW